MTNPVHKTTFRRGALRLFAEFLIVFLSVVLALLADEWRTNRSLQAEERRVLGLISNELAVDADNLLFYEKMLISQAEAAGRFSNHINAQGPTDSLVATMREVDSNWNYRPTYPTYNGVAASGRLDLISNDELRKWIVEYHDDIVFYLDDLRAEVVRKKNESGVYLEKYFGYEYQKDTGKWEYSFIGSREELFKDALLLSSVGRAARQRTHLVSRIEALFIPANDSVQAQISSFLNGSQLDPVAAETQ